MPTNTYSSFYVNNNLHDVKRVVSLVFWLAGGFSIFASHIYGHVQRPSRVSECAMWHCVHSRLCEVVERQADPERAHHQQQEEQAVFTQTATVVWGLGRVANQHTHSGHGQRWAIALWLRVCLALIVDLKVCTEREVWLHMSLCKHIYIQ